MTHPPKVVHIHNPCERRDECWRLQAGAWLLDGVNLMRQRVTRGQVAAATAIALAALRHRTGVTPEGVV